MVEVNGSTQVHDSMNESAFDQEYKYRSLEESDTIRLLELYPGAPDKPLLGAIRHVRLSDVEYSDLSSWPNVSESIVSRHTFEAISYVWGTPSFTCHLECSSGIVPITTSLDNALRRVRLRRRTRTVWADGICINQKNLNERGHQVKLMRRIYRGARRVLIWLGNDQYGCSFRLFSSLRAFPSSAMKKEMVQELLSECLWFERAWVVQEASLGRSALAMSGTEELDWRTLAEEIEAGQPNLPQERLTAVSVSTSDAYDLIPTLNRARGLKCTDPRDRVFAFLGLNYRESHGSTKIAGAIEPNYNIPTFEVYYDFGMKVLEAGHLISLLQAVNHGPSLQSWPTNLPSWIPDWRTPASQPISQYSSPYPTRSLDLQTQKLWVSGIRFDVVQSVSRKFTQNLDCAADRNAVEDFWSTEVLPLSEKATLAEGQLAPNVAFCAAALGVLPLSEKAALAEGLFMFNVAFCAAVLSSKLCDGWNLITPLQCFVDMYSDAQIKNEMSNSQMIASITHSKKVLDTMKHRLWYPDPCSVNIDQRPAKFLQGTRLFRTTRNFIGSGAEALRQGDIVVFLKDACDSCILRPQQGFYQYVGAAFLSGFTEYNIYRAMDGKWPGHEDFELR